MFLGRLSVNTVAEAEAVVAKITGYSGTEQRRVLMVVDSDDRTFSFAKAASAIGNTISPAFTTDRFSITTAAGRPDLLSAISSRPMIVNYVGHGSIEGWSNTSILRSQDVGSLTGTGSTPFFVMMDCLNAYFADVYTNSLGEAVLAVIRARRPARQHLGQPRRTLVERRGLDGAFGPSAAARGQHGPLSTVGREPVNHDR